MAHALRFHDHRHHASGPEHHAQGHTHGVVDPAYVTTAAGLRALKWSFLALGVGAGLQLLVVLLSGSVALLADTIHNAADAATAIPLAIAFVFARQRPSDRFTYGYGRVEDFAGLAIVIIIFMSAVAAGYESIRRLLEPRPIAAVGAVAIAALVGFAANETAALIRVRTGRAIQSVALIADGQHARIDGLASLAVAAGAVAVRFGYPLADPIIGLGIAALILGIVWQSAIAVGSRMLDGIDPELIAEIRRAGEHVAGVRAVDNIRARWLGHRLHAEADIAVAPGISHAESLAIARALRAAVEHHLPGLGSLHVATRVDR